MKYYLSVCKGYDDEDYTKNEYDHYGDALIDAKLAVKDVFGIAVSRCKAKGNYGARGDVMFHHGESFKFVMIRGISNMNGNTLK